MEIAVEAVPAEGEEYMFSPESLIRVHRRIKDRKVKALGVNAMRFLGMRHMVIRMDTINLCNLRCKMCYYSSDYNRKKEEMDLPLFRKIAGQVFPKTRFLYLSCATEPTLNKQFASFIRTTGEYKVPFTSFCTNGQLLREDVIQACIETKSSEIIFSVDGATAGDGGTLGSNLNESFTTGSFSNMRLQQLMAQLGYLPMTFKAKSGPAISATSARAQLSAAYHAPAGTFTWQSGWPGR